MILPEHDLAYLAERWIDFSVVSDGNMTCVIIPGFVVPPGYDRSHAALLLRLSPGYPDIAPDMWWFDPAVRLANGRPIQATDSMELYLGRTWQRWSRHFSPGQWQSGVDGLESFFALIRKELLRPVHELVQ